MAAIPCPQCKRVLNLPDDREIEVVACPMCKHTFAPPSTPKIIPALIPAPIERIPLRFPPFDDDARPGRPLVPIEEDEDYPQRPWKGEDQKALESAGGYLKSMGWIGLVHTLPCCGCLAYASAESGGYIRPGADLGMYVYLAVSAFVYVFILIGARALKLQSSFGWAVAGVALALLLTSGLILINVPVVLSFLGIWSGQIPVLGEPCCGVLLGIPTLLVIGCGLAGGIKGLLALMRPGARELFLANDRRM